MIPAQQAVQVLPVLPVQMVLMVVMHRSPMILSFVSMILLEQSMR
jgi:hypothetical protein